MRPRPPSVAGTGDGAPHPRDERQEVHNTSVDERVADRGACGQLHVPTGRTCTLEPRHPGSCNFVARDQVDRALAEHPTHPQR